MAQLRQDYDAIVERGAEVVVVGPDSHEAFKAFWKAEDMPFIGLADPDHSVSNRFGQRVKMLRFGRMPSLLVIDRDGKIRFRRDGESMRDIVDTAGLLGALDSLGVDTA